MRQGNCSTESTYGTQSKWKVSWAGGGGKSCLCLLFRGKPCDVRACELEHNFFFLPLSNFLSVLSSTLRIKKFWYYLKVRTILAQEIRNIFFRESFRKFTTSEFPSTDSLDFEGYLCVSPLASRAWNRILNFSEDQLRSRQDKTMMLWRWVLQHILLQKRSQVWR